MKQSLIFIPTLREMPKDAEIPSHKILLKGGYVKQHVAGVYSYLPLAYRVIKKIENIVREELDNIGCSELLLPALQAKELWVESGRWDEYGKELIRLKDRHDREFCLGPTHEEVISVIARDYINSYKKLPLALYQIQTKFRDEFRPRFGLMRGREFIMKDLYTFHSNEEDLKKWYNMVRVAYTKILDRLELDYRVVSATSGQIGGSFSEEFMVLTDKGEDTIVYNEEGTFASNIELSNLAVGEASPDGVGIIKHAQGIEVGHIFNLGTKYSEAMNIYFTDELGKKQAVIMGCYGMGISRLIMAVLEQHNDDLKVLWPKEIEPFNLHIIPADKPGSIAYLEAEKLASEFENKGLEVLFDDRSETVGVKFNDADLIGIRHRLIVGKKINEGIVELKDLKENSTKFLTIEELKKYNFE